MPPKPYLKVPIEESGERLVPIPKDIFVCQHPHVYQALGAPYGNASPFFVREQVLQALLQAQANVQQKYPSWKILIFDAYRPVAVQAFMVNHAFNQALQQQNLDQDNLTPAQTDKIWEQVYQLWALPNLDPQAPPPHSTGGAVDVTLYDCQTAQTVFMGSPIDELSERSQPNYFANLAKNPDLKPAAKAEAGFADQNRQILYHAMRSAGFQRHLGEWWHFCLGDQMWAWLTQQNNPDASMVAYYGRIE